MRFSSVSAGRQSRFRRAFSLVEVLVAMGIGSVVLAGVAALTMFGARSFAAMANYVDLDARSRDTVDGISRELRGATAVIAFATNLPIKFITLTNASDGATMKLTFNSIDRTLVYERSGQSAKTYLTQCDSWRFDLFNRVPLLSSTNITFHRATNGAGQLDPAAVKLITMSWKCSRPILGAKFNTESVQMAQIVLRNKVQ